MTRAILITNPAARAAARAVPAVTREAERAGVSLTVLRTSAPGHAAELARQHGPAADVVFTLGGDGTAMEALDALAGSGVPVGVLPGGTGNILVRSLGIPLSPRRALRALAEGYEVRMDLGRLGDGRRFAIGVGVGADATMILRATPALKRRAGVGAYMLLGAQAVAQLERFQATVTVDGEVVTTVATSVLVANFGMLLHDLVVLGDGIRRDDGLLDVCIFTPNSWVDVARISARLMWRDFSPDPSILRRRGREIMVVTDPPRPAQADGELVGSSPLTIGVEPLAATLLVPARYVQRRARDLQVVRRRGGAVAASATLNADL